MIKDFILEKMTDYISVEMKPENAAHFTRRELGAIYKGQHWTRNAAGKMEPTEPPEAMDAETAMAKADAGIAVILATCVEMEREKRERKLNIFFGAGSVPKGTPGNEKRNGLEGLKKYAKRETT